MSKGWGGIGEGDVPEDVYLVGDCPHDWLFERVACVVHHGGAGTTAAGLAASCPTIVIPFFGDQPFWGQMIARAGAGPNPVPFKKMTAEILAESIVFSLRPEVQAAAKGVAKQIAEEDGARSAAQDIQERIDSEGLRCDICPERLAVWKHTKTGAHLSSLASFYLVNKGFIKVKHLRFIRHKHWYVDEGAESVIIGLVAAASGFFTDVGVATSHYVRNLQSRPGPRARRKSSTRPQLRSSPASSRTARDSADQDLELDTDFTPKQLEEIARRVAKKPPKNMDGMHGPLSPDEEAREFESVTRLMSRQRDEQGRLRHVYHASADYAADLGRAGLKAPVALFYNAANGLRNFPSYAFGGQDMRRRDEIVGVKTGVKVAGKEFVLGFYDALSGIVVRPYKGAKNGPKGFSKGVFAAGWGLVGGIAGGKYINFSFALDTHALDQTA